MIDLRREKGAEREKRAGKEARKDEGEKRLIRNGKLNKTKY